MRNVIYCWFDTDSHDWPLIYINLNLNSWLEMTNEEDRRKQNSNFVLFSPTPACTNQLFIFMFLLYSQHFITTLTIHDLGGKGLFWCCTKYRRIKRRCGMSSAKRFLATKMLNYFLLAIDFLRRRPLNFIVRFLMRRV